MNIDTAIHGYAGPCAFCGRPDKRHRLFDAVRDRVRAGDTVEDVANDYDLSVEAVRWMVDQRRFNGRRKAVFSGIPDATMLR